MNTINISQQMICDFKVQLLSDEKSDATISKYMHDIQCFIKFMSGRPVDKSLILEYKSELAEKYAIASANSMIAALNAFLRFINLDECCVKQFKVQKKVYCSEEKELTKAEYVRLVETAKRKGNERLNLILQTICGTGVRVSELQYITVDAVEKGECLVSCKNKTRTVFIVRELQKKLLQYIRENNIVTGCIFVTKTLKGLKRRKRYYLQVRPYVKSGSKIAYGKWSIKWVIRTK